MTTETSSPQTTDAPLPKRPAQKPLTNPADLFQLFGRFLASWFIFLMAVVNLFLGAYDRALTLGLVSTGMFVWAVRLWKRLRKERQAALEARMAEAQEREIAP